jgi:hypothetical protein
MQDTRLTKEDIDFIVLNSKLKAQAVRDATYDIFNELTNSNEQEKQWLEKFDAFILTGRKGRFSGIQPKLEENKTKELWKDGWITIDPYWKWNFKAITPIIKRTFFDKKIGVGMVKTSFSREGMNIRFKEAYGGLVPKFISEFNSEGEKYIRKLIANGIMQKISKREENNYKNWRGIPKGVVCDLLGAMRTFGNK